MKKFIHSLGGATHFYQKYWQQRNSRPEESEHATDFDG